MKNFLKIIFFILLTLISCRYFFHFGVPVTHDGNNHLVRFANYKIAVRELQIPPRIAPNLVNGYGYPVFNYNYPLANILSLPFSILNIHYEIAYKMIVTFFIFIAFVGANLFLKSKNFSKSARAFALMVFALNPYILTSIIFRGNVGEVMAWGILPWIFYFLEKIKDKKIFFNKNLFFLILCLSALFLAHNIVAFFASILIIFYLVFTYKNNWLAWKKFVLGFVWSFIIALWFWLPAIMEKNLTILDNVDLTLNYAQHFPNLMQLLRLPIQFGYSYWGQIDSMSFGLGAVQLLITFLAGIYLFKNKTKKNLVFFIALFVLVIGQLKIAQPLYEIIPFANFIQFPWRLALLFSIVLLPISALIFSKSKKSIKLILIFVIVLQFLQFLQIKPIDYQHQTDLDYETYGGITSVNQENMPKFFTFEYFNQRPAPISILAGQGTIDTKKLNGSSRHYFLELVEKSIIVESTAYFPGWETTANNKKIEYLDNEIIRGRIAYELDPGKYEIKTRFTQKTWSRLLGNSLSAFGLITFFSLGLYLWQKDKRNSN